MDRKLERSESERFPTLERTRKAMYRRTPKSRHLAEEYKISLRSKSTPIKMKI